MSSSRSSLERLIRKGQKALRQAKENRALYPAEGKLEQVPADVVDFARKWLGFQPTPYQADLLTDTSKRIAVIFPRQSGKTTTLAVRMIHFVLKNPRTLSLIVTPGLRQSMIVMDRVQEQLSRMPHHRRRELVQKIQRTVITFRNGSKIVALPCSVNYLRGYAANLLIIDEAAFFRDDQAVFHSVLFPMLQTTRGTLIASSTPWGKDSVFYQLTRDPTFKVHKITIDDVIKAGLATEEFVREMERRTPRERYRREYLAEFVEDELAYFPSSMITSCIDPELEPIPDEFFV